MPGINYRHLREDLAGKGLQFVSDSLQEALEKKQVLPSDFSIAALFETTVPDGAELIRLMKQGGVMLTEASDAVSLGAFTKLTSNLVFQTIQNRLTSEEYVFSRIIPTMKATHHNGEVVAMGTALGDRAEIVGEGNQYPHAGLGEDWVSTPPPVKRGFIVPVTKEVIVFDRTGDILREAARVGDSMALNKEKRLIDAVIDENTTAHRYRRKNVGPVATYGDNSGTHDWDNLQASNGFVDWTDVDTALQLFNAIVDPNTGEPVAISPTHIVTAMGLQASVNRFLNATELSVYTPGFATSGNPTQTTISNPYRGAYQPVTSRLLAARLATDTDWFIGNLTQAFAYMEAWPATVTQAPPNSYEEFNRDIAVQYKVSEMGAAATIEPRLMVKNTA